MPPTAAKGKGKAQSREPRRSHSRNTTPISTNTEGSSASAFATGTSSYLHTSLAQLLVPTNTTLEGMIDRHGNATSTPSASSLNTMEESLRTNILAHVKARGDICDRGMRELAKRRKERMEIERERDLGRERLERESEEKRAKMKKAKSSLKREREEERPMAVGAHGVARQDGLGLKKDASSLLSSPVSAVPPAASTSVIANDSPTSPSNSESSHQPPPAPAVPQHYLFGADPSKFPDDTVYHIRELTPDMTEEEKKAILCVSHYPQSDLHDLMPGTPPDRDFSNGKVPNQVNFEAFSKYLEPYIRPLTEEDIAFLKERGDRVTPYVMPRRGARHYKEIWAEEDGAMAIDLPNQNDLPPNEPRGSMEQMSDDVAETDEISTGPVLARPLATMCHTSNPNSTSQLHNGDTDVADTDNPEQATDAIAAEPTFRPATHMAETSQPGWKPPPTPGPDYATMDERLKLELRHIGFLSDSAEPDYDGHYDDEVAARLRFLQSELKRVSALNGARKARLLELAEERMAGQEYGTIADDLDNQLNQAYLKRNRNIGKGKNKTKRPGAGGAAGGAAGPGTGVGVSRQSVGEPIRQLMERKRDWNGIIGPVVGFGAASIPKESVFDEESMARLMKKEEEGLMEVEQ
ncbi:hypothetical protein B0A49_01421 [Cryomyces minteri]|uniref:Transcriptional regulator Ngg1 n=1 Tax=Cryomyces minteri TaxID=331657 RepID=A0A4U0XMX2_9PEZI|nr:hypothetical protein B0A49_01421 [Cryomyces minteri]